MHHGELLGLIGPNGGGKSTLLLLLAGLLRPSDGEVTLDGQPAHALATAAAGRVGLITATPGLYPALTLRENLRWFAGLHGLDAPTVDARVDALADGLGLGAQLDQPTATLSSGQAQKGSLIRALTLQPRVLLFDEPTANLDPLSAATLQRRLRDEADGGRAVVLCTHDLYAAHRLCDRVAVLNRTLRGVVQLEGPRDAAPTTPLHAHFEAACS